MTNEALQNLIGSWFPNPEADKVSEVIESSDIEEASDLTVDKAEGKPKPQCQSTLVY